MPYSSSAIGFPGFIGSGFLIGTPGPIWPKPLQTFLRVSLERIFGCWAIMDWWFVVRVATRPSNYSLKSKDASESTCALYRNPTHPHQSNQLQHQVGVHLSTPRSRL